LFCLLSWLLHLADLFHSTGASTQPGRQQCHPKVRNSTYVPRQATWICSRYCQVHPQVFWRCPGKFHTGDVIRTFFILHLVSSMIYLPLSLGWLAEMAAYLRLAGDPSVRLTKHEWPVATVAQACRSRHG
jgi:hypothetical protein